MNNMFAKIKVSTAAEICARFDLKQEAQALLRDEIAPREFVYALAANRQYLAGIDFMAHGLPPREAIWWGCLCLQHASGDQLSELDKAACRAAVKWVLEPAEENRLAAKVPAEKAGQASPAGALAAASHQTEDPSTLPVPGRKLSFAPARSVIGAIKLASTKADPSRIVDMHRLFLELGVGVAEGRFRWPEIDQKTTLQK
jgi:hypothetical protein